MTRFGMLLRMASNSAKETNKHIGTQLLTLMYKYKNDFTIIHNEGRYVNLNNGFPLPNSPNSNLVITLLET